MKKLYEQSPEMQLSGKCQLRHVKCTHHKGYLMEDLSMIKSGFYEISFCKSGDFLFRIGQKRHFITNGDILVIPPDIPHYFTSSDLVANYYDFITVWLEKSYISNLKSQLPALKESVFNIDTPHLLHTTNKLCNFEEEFETFYREYASYGELSETYACGASTCLLVKVINYALKYSNEFIEIESDQTNQIVRYLDQHFLKEIGVEDLARTFHMSKSSLNKFFQKQLNTTCHQYILKKRLALAVSLIRQDVPLKTVAVQSGFGDYSSFFRAFKKMYETLNLGVLFIFYLIIFNYSINSTICGVFLVKIHNFYIYGSCSHYFVNMLPCYDMNDHLIRFTHFLLCKLSDIADCVFYKPVSAMELLSYLLLPFSTHNIRLILNL